MNEVSPALVISGSLKIQTVIARNGHIWVGYENGPLVYYNVNWRGGMSGIEVSCGGRGVCDMFSVRPDGKMCLVRINRRHFIVSAEDGKVQWYDPEFGRTWEKCRAVAASWLIISGESNIFITFEFQGCIIIGQYVVSSKAMSRLDKVSVFEEEANVLGLFVYELQNGFKAIVGAGSKNGWLMTQPVVVDECCASVSCNSNLHVPSKNPWVAAQDDALVMNADGLVFLVMLDAGEIEAKKVVRRQYGLKVDAADQMLGIGMVNRVPVIFGQEKMFFCDVEGGEDKPPAVVLECKVAGMDNFALDSVTKQIYGIEKGNVYRIDFGEKNVVTWLYEKLIKRGIYSAAADALMEPGLDANELLHRAKGYPYVKLEILWRFLSKTRGVTKMRRAMAKTALDLYAQRETARSTPNVHFFGKWVNNMIQEGLIDMDMVRRVLAMYDWEAPLMANPPDGKAVFTSLPIMFDTYMATGQKDRAIGILGDIKDLKEFVPRAMRLSESHPSDVSKCTGQFQEITSQMIPLVFLDGDKSHIYKPYTSKKLLGWERDMLCIAMTEDLSIVDEIISFLKNASEDDALFMRRCLVKEKRYEILAKGLYARGEYVEAAKAISAVDPTGALRYLPDDMDPSARTEAVKKIAQRISYSDAEKFVSGVFVSGKTNGIGLDTLFRYLPGTMPVRNLMETASDFAKCQRLVLDERKAVQDTAVKGIEECEALKETIGDKPRHFSCLKACEKCKEPALQHPSIVYPCGHILHRKCAEELVSTGEKPDDACPMCGLWCVQAIDEAFTRHNKQEWSVSPNDLLSSLQVS